MFHTLRDTRVIRWCDYLYLMRLNVSCASCHECVFGLKEAMLFSLKSACVINVSLTQLNVLGASHVCGGGFE